MDIQAAKPVLTEADCAQLTGYYASHPQERTQLLLAQETLANLGDQIAKQAVKEVLELATNSAKSGGFDKVGSAVVQMTQVPVHFEEKAKEWSWLRVCVKDNGTVGLEQTKADDSKAIAQGETFAAITSIVKERLQQELTQLAEKQKVITMAPAISNIHCGLSVDVTLTPTEESEGTSELDKTLLTRRTELAEKAAADAAARKAAEEKLAAEEKAAAQKAHEESRAGQGEFILANSEAIKNCAKTWWTNNGQTQVDIAVAELQEQLGSVDKDKTVSTTVNFWVRHNEAAWTSAAGDMKWNLAVKRDAETQERKVVEDEKSESFTAVYHALAQGVKSNAQTYVSQLPHALSAVKLTDFSEEAKTGVYGRYVSATLTLTAEWKGEPSLLTTITALPPAPIVEETKVVLEETKEVVEPSTTVATPAASGTAELPDLELTPKEK